MITSELKQWLLKGHLTFLQHVSVDCVIFGFHDNQLKVLLLKWKNDGWCLPGGFVKKTETLEDSAQRVLKERTGLAHTFMRQFNTFSALNRDKGKKPFNIPGTSKSWYMERFISVGFWALVEYSKVKPHPDWLSEECRWWDIHEVPKLIYDHNFIVTKALESLRLSLNDHPVGYDLLPEKFTMRELQELYETILDTPIDRRNFRKKILSLNILIQLKAQKPSASSKPSILYRFDKKRYEEATRKGLMTGF